MLTNDQKQRIQQEHEKYPHPKTGIIHALFIAQETDNRVEEEDVEEIGDIFDLDATEIWSVASFYTMINQQDVGEYLIQVCDNFPCMLRGAEGILDYFSQCLDIDVGETTPDGLFTLKNVECLGSCGTAPMCQVNDRPYHENLSRDDVEQLIDDLREEHEQNKSAKTKSQG